MPSLEHQWLVLWVARKMERDGFVVRQYDAPTPQGGMRNALPSPGNLGRFRPDVVGMGRDSATWAIGEAKSHRDVDTAHTRRQLGWFGRLTAAGGLPAALYVAVPLTARNALERVLHDVGLAHRPGIYRVVIPDCLVPDRENHVYG